MKKLLIYIILLIGVFDGIAQERTITAWVIQGVGSYRNQLYSPGQDVVGVLSEIDNELYFALWKRNSNEPVSPIFLITNLNMDNKIPEEGNTYIGIKGNAVIVDDKNQRGTVYFNIANEPSNDDVIHFDLGTEDLYLAGYINKDEWVSNLFELVVKSSMENKYGKRK